MDSTAVETILSESVPQTNDISVPNWLDGDFLEKHLRNYFNSDQLKIVDFEVKPATAKGENYASYIYRVNVTFTKNPNKSQSANDSVSR